MNRLFFLGLAALLGVFFFACGKKSDPRLPVLVAPKPVKNFNAIVRPESITLFWKSPVKNTNDSPLIDLSGFMISRSEVPIEKACLKCPKDFINIFDYDYSGPRGKVPEGGWMLYHDKAISFGTFYTYKIICYTENKTLSPPSSFVNIYCEMPLSPPSIVSSNIRGSVITVEWEQPMHLIDGTSVNEVEGFNIYRSEKKEENELFPLNKEIIKGSKFEDIQIRDEGVYYYGVRAIRKVEDTLIESALSEKTAVHFMDITPPPVPQGLTAIPKKDGVLLKWISEPDKDLAGFNIYRKAAMTESFIRLNEKVIKEKHWIDKSATIGKGYIYGVTSVDGSPRINESDMSETVEIKYIY